MRNSLFNAAKQAPARLGRPAAATASTAQTNAQTLAYASSPLDNGSARGNNRETLLSGLAFGRALLNLWAFWPCVLRIAAHQFSSNLWIETLPKSREVRCSLDRAMIWGEQMDDERCLIRADPGSVEHPEEILKAG